MAGSVPAKVTPDMPQFVKDYSNFYETKLGYHENHMALHQVLL